MPTTADLIRELRAQRLDVYDLRGRLPEHYEKRFRQRNPDAVQGLCVHHSAGPTGGVDRVRQIAEYHVGPSHVSSTGAPGILYTLAVTDAGEVCVCHDLTARTWSQGDKTRPGDENAEFLAVLCVGDFASPGHAAGEPTPEQVHGLLGVIVACRRLWGRSFELTGHFALGKPACPGATLQTLVQALATHVERPPAPEGLETLRDVQQALVRLGYDPGPVDGLDGPRTRAAVAAFQRDQKLTVDGIAGPHTRGLLAVLAVEADDPVR